MAGSDLCTFRQELHSFSKVRVSGLRGCARCASLFSRLTTARHCFRAQRARHRRPHRHIRFFRDATLSPCDRAQAGIPSLCWLTLGLLPSVRGRHSTHPCVGAPRSRLASSASRSPSCFSSALRAAVCCYERPRRQPRAPRHSCVGAPRSRMSTSVCRSPSDFMFCPRVRVLHRLFSESITGMFYKKKFSTSFALPSLFHNVCQLRSFAFCWSFGR